jgi:hypothetical protein
VFLMLTFAVPAAALSQSDDRLGAGSEERGAPSWHFMVSATSSWYDNASFEGSSSAGSAWSAHGTVALSHQGRFRTGGFSISAFGGAIYYPDANDFNQPTYGGAFNLNWTASRGTTLTFGQVYRRTSTRDLTPVDTQGLPLPTTAINTSMSSVGLKHKLSKTWQLGMNASFLLERFDDPRLVGGDQLNAGLSLQHQIGRQTGLYGQYSFSSAFYENDRPAQRSHQALLGGQRQVEHGVGFELAGGAGYVEATHSFYPSGRAGLTASERHLTFSLLYHRDFGQAFGYGRQMIGDLVSAGLTWAASRSLSFRGGYNFGYRRDPADESYTITSWVATAGFNWTIGGGVGLGAYYAWEHNDTQGLSVVQGGRVGANLHYGVDWR